MFLLASGLRQNQTISVKEKAQASLTSNYSNSDQECTRGKNVEVLLLILPLLISLSIQLFNPKFNKQSQAHLLP